jgi:hypothetical protein
MNPVVLLFLISMLAEARTRRHRLKAKMVILTVHSQQQGQVNLTHLRRMARNTSDDSLVVHLLAALREEPTGVNDPCNSDVMMRIKKYNSDGCFECLASSVCRVLTIPERWHPSELST